MGGHTNSSSTGSNGHYVSAGALTGATTVTAYTGNTTSITKHFNCTVIEFNSGVISSSQNVSESGLASSSNTTGTETITSVGTSKSIVAFMGVSFSTAGATWTNHSIDVVLTDATTITSTRVGTGSITNLTSYARVTEFV